MVVPALIFVFLITEQNTKMVGEFLWQQILFSSPLFQCWGKEFQLLLKFSLTALAIVDDLGAIVVIAIFYTEKLEFTYLALSGAILLL